MCELTLLDSRRVFCEVAAWLAAVGRPWPSAGAAQTDANSIPRPSCLQNSVTRCCQAGQTHDISVLGEGGEGYN